MRAEPKEVSTDKATTPGQRERFEAAYAAHYNQLRNADYTAEHIASMRKGEGYGERAFLNGWWEGWKAAEAQQAARWTNAKPTVPGAYWVRGFRVGEQNYRPALVEVARNEAGALVCNMNDSNTNDELREWSLVEDLAERFEWFGPLASAAVNSDQTQVLRLVGYLDSAYVNLLQGRQKITCTLFADNSEDGNLPVYSVEVPHA